MLGSVTHGGDQAKEQEANQIKSFLKWFQCIRPKKP